MSDKCKFCEADSVDFCSHCGQDFCLNHKSRYNSRLCHECVSDTNIATERQPLTEDDGTTHEGYKIKLIGQGWPHSLEMIHNLTDEQLEVKISEQKTLIKEAQLTLDYHRILHSAAEFERSERKHSATRKLMRKKLIEEGLEKQGYIKLNKKSHKVMSLDSKAEMIAMQLGITVEQAKKVIQLTSKPS